MSAGPRHPHPYHIFLAIKYKIFWPLRNMAFCLCFWKYWKFYVLKPIKKSHNVAICYRVKTCFFGIFTVSEKENEWNYIFLCIKYFTIASIFLISLFGVSLKSWFCLNAPMDDARPCFQYNVLHHLPRIFPPFSPISSPYSSIHLIKENLIFW